MIAVGVDTHKTTHTAVAADNVGTILAQTEIRTDEEGYEALLAWSLRFGQGLCFGIEGTGSYGAGLCEFLINRGLTVYEVEQPKRRSRRKGKSDSIDALCAAKAVLSGEGSSKPRSRGKREALRAMFAFYDSCVVERNRLINQLEALRTAAPNALRARIGRTSGPALIRRVATARCARDASEVEKTTLVVMKDTVGRIRALDPQVSDYLHKITEQVKALNPALLDEPGVGPITAAKLLVVDVGRFDSESKFARANGTAPIPASSGKRQRQRLNRGGDRQANYAIHMIALARSRFHEESRHYYQKKIREGKSKKEAMRCLKRKVSKRLYRILLAPA